jgi:hypothetical protein
MGRLLVLQSLWAMERRHSDGLERFLDTNVAMTAQAGFGGVSAQCENRSEHATSNRPRRRGPGIICRPAVSSTSSRSARETPCRRSASLPEMIDLVLLDGAKALYPKILSLAESRLRPAALIVADNADMSPDYLARVRSPAAGYMSTPFADDVELSMRIG